MNMLYSALVTTALMLILAMVTSGCEGEDEGGDEPVVSGDDFIAVKNPVLLPERLTAQRIRVDDQVDAGKPCIARLPGGELLLVMFNPRRLEGDRYQEDIILYRSNDGGVTWSERQILDLLGREPYLTVLKDGTIFITVHLLRIEWRNEETYSYCYLHRSTDGGHTWTSMRIDPTDLPEAPPNAEMTTVRVSTSRNLLERDDGVLLFGVSATYKNGDHMWQSTDSGETWDKSRRLAHPTDEDREQFYGFEEGTLWQTQSGQVFMVKRVPTRFHHPAMDERPIPTGSDQVHRMLLFESTDDGYTWGNISSFSDYGEMYPSILRLQDGRLLFTFTVRSLKVPLGVQAVLGYEDEEGIHFDFEHDRLILDHQAPKETTSGGGFGPTVQLDDGTLVTSYSYQNTDKQTRVEVVRWNLPPR